MSWNFPVQLVLFLISFNDFWMFLLFKFAASSMEIAVKKHSGKTPTKAMCLF